MRISLETALRDLIERIFAVVAIGRVADIVVEPGHVTEIRIEAEAGPDAAGNLANFERVGKPGARGIAITWAYDLGFIRQSPQRSRVQDASAVAGEYPAVFFDIANRGPLRPFFGQPGKISCSIRIRHGVLVYSPSVRSASLFCIVSCRSF